MGLGVSCGERKWMPPPEGVIRVDVDAMYNEQMNRFGVGIILRDCNGQIRAAMAKKTMRKANAMIAETMAIVEGIILSMKYDVEVITIYMDSLLVARLMEKEEEFDDLLPQDISDIVKKARESFLVGVFHMYRSANRAAHSLAQRSVDFGTEKIWEDSFPSWLRDIVSNDLSG